MLDWTDEEKPDSNILRLIYQGRFLHGNVTLGALQLSPGKTTVMHLVARENLPEPSNRGMFTHYYHQRVAFGILNTPSPRQLDFDIFFVFFLFSTIALFNRSCSVNTS